MCVADKFHSKENPHWEEDRATEVEEGQGPCRLVQRAGEVLFVPRHWTHQVLNLDHVVGLAAEVKNYVY